MFSHIFKFSLFATYLLLMLSFMLLQGSECETCIKSESVFHKIYVNSDQLIFSEKGLFVLLQDADGALAKILVPQINYDEEGLFVFAVDIPAPFLASYCRFGHRLCEDCGKCTFPGCYTAVCKCGRW